MRFLILPQQCRKRQIERMEDVMKKVADKIPAVVRTIFGLLFLVSGVAGLLHLMPQPEMPDRAQVFMHALAYSWILPLTKVVESVAGLMLVAGLFAPLALVLLAPVIVNVAAFHLLLAPGGIPMAVILVGIEIYLAYVYRDAYRPLFARKAKPVPAIA
jgi:uncharacterized membrane protein YphA (DoxX/SURF4 family)